MVLATCGSSSTIRIRLGRMLLRFRTSDIGYSNERVEPANKPGIRDTLW